MENKNKGIVLHCPICKKLLMRDVLIQVGDNLVTRCYNCKGVVEVKFDNRRGILISAIKSLDIIIEKRII